jgi:hypothetical protein
MQEPSVSLAPERFESSRVAQPRSGAVKLLREQAARDQTELEQPDWRQVAWAQKSYLTRSKQVEQAASGTIQLEGRQA